MIKVTFLGAAGLLALLLASPASAQQVIDEPGMFAFYHPNGDLRLGSSRPPADTFAMVPAQTMQHLLFARRGKARR